MSFTGKWVEAVPYLGDGTQPDFHWDGSIGGFGLVVYQSGKKSFVLKYRFHGKQRMKLLGRTTVLTLNEAKQKALSQLKALAEEKDPLHDEKCSATFEAFGKEYLMRWSKPRNKTWEKDKYRIEEVLIPEWGTRKLKSITKEDVGELHSKIGSECPFEANRIRRLISSMFNRAKEWNFLGEEFKNPAKAVTEYPEPTRDVFITEEMMPTLIASIDSESDIQVRIGMRLYMLTGLRHLELLSLKWTDISFANQYCRLGNTKQGQVVYHALSEEAVNLLLKLPKIEGNPWVFPGKLEGKRRYCFETAWKRIRKRAGTEFKDVRLHDLRRTTGSWMAISGFSLKEIGEVLHQSNQHVTNVYARLQLKHKRPLVEAISKALTDNWTNKVITNTSSGYRDNSK